MLGNGQEMVSPTRTYVAFCNGCNFEGYYFRKFTLPASIEEVPQHSQNLAACQDIATKNNAWFASWYFLNVLDLVACINGCITFEDYSDFRDVRSQ